MVPYNQPKEGLMKKFMGVALALAFAFIGGQQAFAFDIFSGVQNNLELKGFENLYMVNPNAGNPGEADYILKDPAALPTGGDRLVGILESRENGPSGPGVPWNKLGGVDEVTGVFAQEVIAVNIISATEYEVVLGNPTSVGTSYDGGAGADFVLPLLAGEQFYIVSQTVAVTPFTSFGTLAATVAAAADGDLLWTLGLAEATDVTLGRPNFDLAFPYGESFGALSVIRNGVPYTYGATTEGPFMGDFVYSAQFQQNVTGTPV
jgi:hypothetical protein